MTEVLNGRATLSVGEAAAQVGLTRLRRTGMPVRDMRRYADLARQGAHTVGERVRLFEEHRQRVLDRIAQLQQDLDFVDYKIDIYRKAAQGG